MKRTLLTLVLALLTAQLWAQATIKNVFVVNATTLIAEVCPGGTFTLSYEVSGFECPNTTFTIELLKPGPNGFVPVQTKTVVDPPFANTATLTVPADAEPDALWQARVYSSRPAGCSKDPLRASGNTVNLRIRSGTSTVGYQLPPYNKAPQSGPLNICVGQQFRLQALPGSNGENYTWTGLETGFAPLTNVKPNGQTIQTTSQTVGNYTATVTPSFPTSTGCLITPGTIAINVSGAVKPTITTSNSTICQGGKATLSLTNSCPGTVTWNNGTSDVGSGNSIVVMPAATTNYTAKCTTTGNCAGSSVSDPLTVTVNNITLDMKAVTTSPSTPTSGPLGANIKLNLSNGDVLTYPSPRLWTVIVTAPCPNVESIQMQLTGPGINFQTVENTAPFALFANNGNTYFTINDPDQGLGAAYNNGWPTGGYSLMVMPRDQDGVPTGSLPKTRTPQGNVLGSKTVNFTIADPGGSPRAGVAEITSTRVQAYPNPTTNRLSLDISTELRQAVSVRLSDLQGRAVYQNDVTAEGTTHHEEINMEKQPSGIYLLKVMTNGRIETLKVLKTTN